MGILSPAEFPVPIDPRLMEPYDQFRGLLTRKASEVGENPTSALIGAALQDPLMLADLAGATSAGRVKRESAGYGPLLGEPPIEVQGLPAGDIARQQLNIDNPAGMTGEMSPLSIGSMLKLGAKGLLGAGQAALGAMGDGGLLAQALFHGTPHKFNMFDLQKIGTGEGVQAKGYGLYFAENPNVAKSYQSDLTHNKISLDGQQLDPATAPPELRNILLDAFNDPEMQGIEGIREKAQSQIDAYINIDGADEIVAESQEIIDTLNKFGDRLEDSKGHLYEIQYPDELVDKMLDYDKPISEQPEIIAAMPEWIQERVAQWTSPYSFGDKVTGEILYESIIPDYLYDVKGIRLNPVNSSMAQTEILEQAGIPGIKFWDQSSRKAGEGTSNIVVFNPDDITQVKRDGEVVF
tara:strand:- start:194 stop:1414 length:1221 start_codon:yes stop_codon:yes gene_type:complete